MSHGTVLDPRTVARILDLETGPTATAPWAGPLAELCYATGLPLERLLAARVADVDLGARLLDLGRDRAVPFGLPAAEALHPLVDGHPPAAPLFTDPAGHRVRTDAARDALNRRAGSAGVQLPDAAAALAASMRAHLLARGADPEVTDGLVDPGPPRRRGGGRDEDPAPAAVGRLRRRLAVRRGGRR